MAKVKNTARGARGIRTQGGDLVMVEPGETAEGDFSASEVKDFKAMLAAEAGPVAPANEPDEDDAVDENDPANFSVAKLTEHVAGISDVEALKALGAAEEKGSNRDGAKKAIQARIDELSAA